MESVKKYSADTTEKLIDSRLDFVCLIEEGDPAPILFENKKLLHRWALENGLNVSSIKSVSGDKAVMVSGDYTFKAVNAYMYVESVWVLARWHGYRKALKQRSIDQGYKNGFSNDLHADHVVARSRLSNVPDAWTQIFEVPAQANTVFGARIERNLPKINAGFRQYNLSGLELLKVFCEQMPKKNDDNIEEVIERVRDQFIIKNAYAKELLDQMEVVARKLINQ